MIAEISLLCLILALGLSGLQSLAPVPTAGLALRSVGTWGQSLLALLAFIGLGVLFLSNDFSVLYVANNSNLDLPLLYKISAIWGAHEGSLLLWSLILAFWTVLLLRSDFAGEEAARNWALAVMAVVAIGMYSFILFTSSPFERNFPIPPDGRSLNPLLQDPGLALHPPMLYFGYVGLAVPFALACAGLVRGELSPTLVRLMRIFALGSWLALSLGIVLGSWWAYNELGWGGWWFWDPVENASFMPWLTAAALVHSLRVSERRRALLHWSCLLAILSFGLSLIGTFLVRSGIITSVHSFASDPSRGLFILAFFAIITGAALTLYLLRMPLISGQAPAHSLFSRASLLLLNNVLLSSMCATVLLGTIYPLIAESLGWGKVSVGPPYFDSVFIPFGALLAVVLGLALHSDWRGRVQRAALLLCLASTMVLSLALLMLIEHLSLLTLLGVALALWVFTSTCWQIYSRRLRYNLAFWGMSCAHIGFAIFIAGVTIVQGQSSSSDVRLSVGEGSSLGGYQFQFRSIERKNVANYTSTQADIALSRDDQLFHELIAEKRSYVNSQNPLTEAAIHANIWRDVYVSLGNQLEDGSWTFRLQIKPLMRWVWAGGVLMALGSALAIVAVVRRRVQAPQPSAS